MAFAIETSLSRSVITEGDSTSLTISAEGTISDIEMPSIDGLKITQSGQQTKSTVTSTSGGIKKITTHDLTFRIQGLKTGVYSFPPIKLNVDKKRFTINGIKLSVREPKSQTPDQLAKEQPNFFMERELSSHVAYISEPIYETLKLYLKRPWQDLDRFGNDHSLLRVIHLDQTRSTKVRKYGSLYTMVEIFRILIPLKSAEIDTGRFGIEVSYVDNSQSSQHYFGNFFRTVKTTKVFAPKKLIGINPLPKQKPPSFSGFVGDVKLRSQLSRNKVKVGESLTLNLIFTAEGWISSLKADIPRVSSALFQIYDDKPTVDEQKTPGKIHGSKTFPYFIIPLKAGTYDLGSYSWSYFDPKLKSYQTLSTQLGTIEVEPENPASGSLAQQIQSPPTSALSSDTPTTATIAVLGEDIFDLRRSTWNSPHRNLTIFICFIWLWILALTAALYRRHYLAKRKPFQASFEQIKKDLLDYAESKDARNFLATLATYASQKTQTHPESITAYDIKKVTSCHFDSADSSGEFAKILDQFENFVFTGKASKTKANTTLHDPAWQKMTTLIRGW